MKSGVLCTRILLVGVLLILAPATQAGILLDKSIVEFKADEPPRQDVVVINDSETENAYVQVEVLEVVNPGTEQEERRKITNPDEMQFIASPAKLVIPPSGRKQVRLVNLAGPSGQEKVYRVNFTPVLPPLEEPGSKIRVVVAYQVLALILPNEPTDDLVAKREGNTLSLENQGNSYVLVSAGRQCDTKGENCQDLPSKRLYAGNAWELQLPYTTPVTFTLVSFKGSRNETY